MTLQRRLPWARAGLAGAITWMAVLATNRSLRRVTGTSMVPTLHAGDLVLTVPVLRHRPGMVVVASDPRDGRPVVKRIAAVGPATITVEGRTIAVPNDHVLLLGDNPATSTDGRMLGPTPVRTFPRRVVARVTRGRIQLLAQPGRRAISSSSGSSSPTPRPS